MELSWKRPNNSFKKKLSLHQNVRESVKGTTGTENVAQGKTWIKEDCH